MPKGMTIDEKKDRILAALPGTIPEISQATGIGESTAMETLRQLDAEDRITVTRRKQAKNHYSRKEL
jgi:predicted transcriptional regulator